MSCVVFVTIETTADSGDQRVWVVGNGWTGGQQAEGSPNTEREGGQQAELSFALLLPLEVEIGGLGVSLCLWVLADVSYVAEVRWWRRRRGGHCLRVLLGRGGVLGRF